LKISRVEVENFKPYKYVTLPDVTGDTEFPEGLFLITGNNSMGKTSLIQAILWGLLGDGLIEDQQRKTLVKAGESGCKVDVTFSLGGIIYRIVRKLTIKRSRTQKVDIDFNEEAVLFKKLRENDGSRKDDNFVAIVNRPRPVNQEVERMLGVSASMIEKTVYVRQKDVDRLALADPVELRRLITTLFGLDEFDRVKSDLSKLGSELQDSITLLKSEVGALAIEKIELHKREEELSSKEKERIESESDLNKILGSLSALPSEEILTGIKTNDADTINKKNELELVNRTISEKTSYMANQGGRLEALNASIKNIENLMHIAQQALDCLPTDENLQQLEGLLLGIITYENQIKQFMECSPLALDNDPVSQPEIINTRLDETSKEIENLEEVRDALHSNIESMTQILISDEVISEIKRNSIKYIEKEMRCPACNKPIDNKHTMVTDLGNEIKQIDSDYSNVNVQIGKSKKEYDQVCMKIDAISKTKIVFQNLLTLCNNLLSDRKKVLYILELYHSKSVEDLLSFLGFSSVRDIISERTSLRLEIEHYRRELQRIEEQIYEENSRYNVYESELSQLRSQEARIVNDIDHLNSMMREYIQELSDDCHSLDDLLKNLESDSVDELIIKRKTIENDANAQRRFLDRLTTQVLMLQDDIRRRESDITKLLEKEKNMIDKENELRHVKYLRGEIDGFISNYVVEGKLVAALREATNDYIFQLTEGRYAIERISSTMRRVRGGMESHGLEIALMDSRDNVIKNKDQLSGGDETALGLALRIAISKLMARLKPFKNSERIPPTINSIIMDEPMASLDSARRRILVSMLTQASSFKQIFLVTHTEADFGDCHSVTLKEKESGERQVIYTPVKL
jgi:DNA repair exonuclease SbcCD ATPase subunit